MKRNEFIQQACYEIKILGSLSPTWNSYFNDLKVTVRSDKRGESATTLTGSIADQAALRGILCKLWDLNLTLISVRRIEMDQP